MSLHERITASLRRFARRHFDIRVVRWLQLRDYQQRWYLRSLLRRQPIDAIIDVGGNAGQFARFLRREVGYRGPILTVEPIPALAASLRKLRERDLHWEILEAALGEEQGLARFNIMNTSPMSSLLKPSDSCASSMMQFNRISQTIEVQVETVDYLLSEHPMLKDKQNVYLKLDVQGYELKVLKGAERSMSRIGALQVELSVTSLYENQPSYLDLLLYLDHAGYLPSLFPAHDYETFPEMIDFDAHFLRRDRLTDAAISAERHGAGA